VLKDLGLGGSVKTLSKDLEARFLAFGQSKMVTDGQEMVILRRHIKITWIKYRVLLFF